LVRCWRSSAVGAVLALVGVCSIIVQALLVGRIVKRIGERRALFAGLMFGAAAFFVYAAAPTGRLFLIGIPIGAMFGLVNPAMQALMTRRVDATEQGQLQGANGSLMGIAGVIAPSLYTLVFGFGANPSVHVPGTPYYLASLLALGACVVAWQTTRPSSATA
jgi:MFS transporter, DHA1 family, tetracycline resistance protein